MRILLASRTYWPSLDGTAEVVRTLAEHLSRSGHEVHVVTSERPGVQARIEEVNGVTVHKLSIAGNQMTALTGEVAAYQSLILENSWDVVHIHGGQMWTIDAVIPIAERIRSKLIFTPHGSPAFGNPEWSAYYERLFAALAAYFHCTTLLSASSPFAIGLLQNEIQHAVIGNGVDVAGIDSSQQSVRASWGFSTSPWVVNVGNHAPVKGHKMIHALARASKKANFSIVGNSYPAEKYGLGRYGVQGGCYYSCSVAARLIPNLFLHQHLKRFEVLAAIKEADVFILPSTTEAFPLVILEAMAAGTPWVGFDVGNLRELKGGIVVSGVKPMQDMLADLLANPEQRGQLGREGKEFVAKNYDWPIILAKYEEIYHA
ncbi:glycosyltransferase family 4 protein [Deinococcus murrayi]|uniref:glycosyltransferase family 4 protein n=1 Tax=Deinococcus murrayi TaxID=68910 RepID=UPI000A049E87|nr:glycosyltransferase family 4 protein [Deinococcus murrayi]